ncbi:hypothetical protein TNCV_4022911 [Trichonephila clavipes]|nr:hypothetical protein TNCV_4022911 [Trichonephila clavipes]
MLFHHAECCYYLKRGVPALLAEVLAEVGKGRGEVFEGKGGVRYLGSHPTQSQTCCGRGSSALLPWRRMSLGWSMIAVQRAFFRHFDILPRGHVPDWKCVLMWMDASEQLGMPPKKGKDLQIQIEHLTMWNEFVCQFRPVCDNDATLLLLIYSPRKGF